MKSSLTQSFSLGFAGSNKPSLLFLCALCTATIGFSALVLSRLVPLWVPGQFVYGWRKSVDPAFLLVACLGIAGLVWIALRLSQERFWSRPRTAGLLGAFWIVLLGVHVSLRCAEPGGLSRLVIVTLSPASGGYYYAAFDSRSQGDWLASYPKLMREHHHVATHPPGGVALMRAVQSLVSGSPALISTSNTLLSLGSGVDNARLQRPARHIWRRDYAQADIAAALWGGLLLLGAASLIPVAVYAGARSLSGPRVASGALLLAALVPSWLLLAPVLDALIALVAALSLATLARALNGRSKSPFVWWFASGFIAGAGLIFSFALGIVAFMALLMAAWSAWMRPDQTRPEKARLFLLSGGALCAGFLVPVAVYAALGVQWKTIWVLTRQLQNETMIQYNRPYRTWIWFNLLDFFSFLGVPATFLLVRSLLRTRREQGHTFLPDFGAVALLTLLLLNFGSNVSAESSRIWMFFMPVLLLASAYGLERDEALPRWWKPAILGAQGLQLVAMFYALDVWSL